MGQMEGTRLKTVQAILCLPRQSTRLASSVTTAYLVYLAVTIECRSAISECSAFLSKL
jgi:hypothetical protein